MLEILILKQRQRQFENSSLGKCCLAIVVQRSIRKQSWLFYLFTAII